MENVVTRTNPDKAFLRFSEKFHSVSDVLPNNSSAYILITGQDARYLPNPVFPFLTAFVSATTAKGTNSYRNPNLAALGIIINGLSAVELPHVNGSPSSDPITDLRTMPYDVTESMTPADDSGVLIGESVRPSISSIGPQRSPSGR